MRARRQDKGILPQTREDDKHEDSEDQTSDSGGGTGAPVGLDGTGTAGTSFAVPATKVPNVNVAPSTLGGGISADGLEMYLTVEGGKYDDGYGGTFDMYVATRASTQDDWSLAVNLGPTLNGATWETPRISPRMVCPCTSPPSRPGGSGQHGPVGHDPTGPRAVPGASR